jgi:hypothetical protein
LLDQQQIQKLTDEVKKQLEMIQQYADFSKKKAEDDSILIYFYFFLF